VSLGGIVRDLRRIARQTGKNFYYIFLVMPREKTRRHVRDLRVHAAQRRPSPTVRPIGGGVEGLGSGRAQVGSALNGAVPAIRFLPALGYAWAATGFHGAFPRVARWHRRWIKRPPATRRLTICTKYCYRVASAVGLVCCPSLATRTRLRSRPPKRADRRLAHQTILRDVKEDAQMGRNLLPLEDLRRFGVSEDDIMNSRATPQFLELMTFEAARAREFYDKARPLLDLIERRQPRHAGGDDRDLRRGSCAS